MKKLDLTGQTFGAWTALCPSKERPSHWTCRCACGTQQDIALGNLRRGGSNGCKKCRWKRFEHPRTLDLKGERFGAWLAIRPGDNDTWFCRCDCGVTKHVNTSSLTKNKSRGCRQCMRQRHPHQGMGGLKHGLHKSSEYASWQSMINRCTNPKHDSFEYYGARGITICERWAKFEHFLADLGRKPSAIHTLDRIDSNGPYAPGNCRWALPSEQNRNKRRSVMVAVRGVTMQVDDAIDYLGAQAQVSTIKKRIQAGWDAEVAITTPARPKRLSIKKPGAHRS